MGNVVSGITDTLGLTNHAGDNAVTAQANAAAAANQTQQNMYNQTRSDLSPYNQAGTQALNTLQSSLNGLMQSYDPSNLQNDPGYQFQLQQGLKAIQGSAAARGSLNSGNTLKALTQYGQNYAQNAYQNALTNFNNDRQTKYNMLSGLVSTGQNAAAMTGNAGTNMANQISANQIGVGNAQAANTLRGQQNLGNFISGAAQAGTAMLVSDKRLKKNIEAVSQIDLDELKAVIKPHFYEYIDPELGAGKNLGIMAQDLEKSKLGRLVVFTDKDGFKKIDLKKFSSLLIASLAKKAA